MKDPKEPLEFSCFDSNPENHGWGYNSPEPIEEQEIEDEDENIEQEGCLND